MSDLRFAMIGAGFWAQRQLAAWREVGGVTCGAICDPTVQQASELARRFGVPAIYADAEEMLRAERLDFVDIVVPVEAHGSLVHLAAAHRLPVICQKPMATTLMEAERMVQACREQQTPFFVHENWRWQRPLRRLQAELAGGSIGAPFRARIEFNSSFPVFDNQPFLRDLEQFILTDVGSHILDAARFLFGEAEMLYCQTRRVNPTIQGEDVATVLLRMNGVIVTCEMSYASRTERERFPETFVLIEGERGSLELAPDYWIRATTENGVRAKRFAPPRYDWADPAYDLVQASMVPCLENLLTGLRGGAAETTAEDNLRTVRLVFAAYKSARVGQAINLSEFEQ